MPAQPAAIGLPTAPSDAAAVSPSSEKMSCLNLPAPGCCKRPLAAYTRCAISNLLLPSNEPSAMSEVGKNCDPNRFIVAFCGSGTGHLTQAMKVVEMLKEQSALHVEMQKAVQPNEQDKMVANYDLLKRRLVDSEQKLESVTGKLSAKMIRKGAFRDKYFEPGSNGFVYFEADKGARGRGVKRTVHAFNVKESGRSLEALLFARKMGEAEKAAAQQLHNLLDQLLVLDPTKRLQPAEALKHPFFTSPPAAAAAAQQH